MTGVPVVLLPHCRAAEGAGGTSDEDVGAALAERLAARAVPHFSLPVLTPSLTAALTRRSALVLTTRYHPVVFAASGGVPVLAVWADEYVHRKQRGVLAPLGLDGWMLALDDVFERGLLSTLDELWHRRTEVVQWLTSWAPDLERRMRAPTTRSSRCCAGPASNRSLPRRTRARLPARRKDPHRLRRHAGTGSRGPRPVRLATAPCSSASGSRCTPTISH